VAERMKLSGTDIATGVAVLVVVFVAVFLAAGSLNLPVPQWLLSALAAAIGVVIWFAILRRQKA